MKGPKPLPHLPPTPGVGEVLGRSLSREQTPDSYLSSSGRLLRALSRHRV